MYTYVRQTKLSNICGRSDYITNVTGKHKQEDVLLIGGPVSDWKTYADYEKSHQMSEEPNNQGRELTVALPNSWANLINRPLLRSRVAALAEKLIGKDTDYQFAVHWNTKKTNLHVHIIFSERRAVSEPQNGKVWDRDIYLTAEGKVARRKADRAVDAQGNFLPPVHRKGEPKENQTFSVKDKVYKSKKWLNDAKKIVSKAWSLPTVPDKKHIPNYLHTYHEGKFPQISEQMRESNQIVRIINKALDEECRLYGYKLIKSKLSKANAWTMNYIRDHLDELNFEENLLDSFFREFSSNYDKISKKKDKIDDRENKKYQKSQIKHNNEVAAAKYYIKRLVDERVLNAARSCGYTYEFQKSLEDNILSASTPLNKSYERAAKKMTVQKAIELLGADEVRYIVSGKIEQCRTADYQRTTSGEFAKQLDKVITYFNSVCRSNIRTNAENHEELEREQKAERERQRRQQEKLALERARERAAKESEYVSPPPVPEPERKKKDTWSR